MVAMTEGQADVQSGSAAPGASAISGTSVASSSSTAREYKTKTTVKNEFYSVPMNRSQFDEFGQLQESDLLDQLGKDSTVPQASRELDYIRLVSLGTYCGPKLTFQKIGRGAETLPFDWSRTRFEGLMHYMRNNFEGFFDFVTRKPVAGSSMVMYRDWYHSFWHDDPTDAGMIERYKRRIRRFMSIDARGKPVLFVRVSGVSEEIERAPELVDELKSRFGPSACLLLILNFQQRACGAGTVAGHPNLLVYFLSGEAHTNMGGAPYAQPVLTAMDWVVGKTINAMPFPSLEKVAACADPSTWGYEGLGGHRAYEELMPDKLVQSEASSLSTCQAVQFEAPLESAVLELASAEVATPDDNILCISLGCSCGPKVALQRMGRGKEALPFDWICTSINGIMHFLEHDFKDFFDYTTKLPVPGEPTTMYRSHWHSFWHDDPNLQATKETYARRIEALAELKESRKQKLFVRTVASTEELQCVGELLGVILRRFPLAGLLLIVDFQTSRVGPIVVDGYEDLLVYLLPGTVHEGSSPAAAYREPIEIALQWIKGEEFVAGSVDDLTQLARLADETHWGLKGRGGLRAFEEEAERPATVSLPQANPQTAQVICLDTDFEVISLGCYSGPRTSSDKMGLCGAQLPFDRITTPFEGLLEFFRTGGQSLKSCKDVSTADSEGPVGESAGQELVASIENFHLVCRSESPKLFVRVVATVEELNLIGQLRDELDAHVGRTVCLLVVVDFQPCKRICCVENQFYILVYFQTGDAHQQDHGAPYRDAITCGLGWAGGKTLEAVWCQDFVALRSLAVGPASGWDSFGGNSAEPQQQVADAKDPDGPVVHNINNSS